MKKEDHGKRQAKAQLASIIELVNVLREAESSNDSRAIDDAREAIYADALSVEVRNG